MSDRTKTDLLSRLDHERTVLLDLLPRFSEQAWHTTARSDGWTAHDIATHLADANYGLALAVLGEITLPLTLKQETAWLDIDEYNQQRQQKNRPLPRDKVESRMISGFDHVRRAIEAIEDFAVPGPYGPIHTKGQWLALIIDHANEHRRDLELLLEQS